MTIHNFEDIIKKLLYGFTTFNKKIVFRIYSGIAPAIGSTVFYKGVAYVCESQNPINTNQQHNRDILDCIVTLTKVDSKIPN